MSEAGPTPAPTRRWSLRALFAIITLLACWTGWGIWSFRDGTGFGAITFVATSFFIAAMLLGALMTFIFATGKKH